MKYSILIWLIALIIGPTLTPAIAFSIGNISASDIVELWRELWLIMFFFSLLVFLPSLFTMMWLLHKLQRKSTGTPNIKTVLILTNIIIAGLIFTVWPLIDHGSTMSIVFPLAYSIAFVIPILAVPLPPTMSVLTKTNENGTDIF